jgi:hypothetical protein
MCSFDLPWFFLQRDGYAPAAEASSSRNFVKSEPLSPKTGDYDFAYSSDTVENNAVTSGTLSNSHIDFAYDM